MFKAEGEVVYARLRGDIDLSNANELKEELSRITPNDAIGIVLDLSEVNYLDSAGIHLIHHVREDLRARRQRLRLVVPDNSVIHDALRLAGLDWQDEITQTVEAGRRALEMDSRPS